MPSSSEAAILESWWRNAGPWTTAVRARQIESRRLVTDRALVEAILERAPRTVLDLGCGEGWLARALAERGITVEGIDAVPALVEQARNGGGGKFHVATYADIAAGRLAVTADVVVCNFALLGKQSVDDLLVALSSRLKPQAAFMVQTLHPLVACGDSAYRDGWRAGSWDGFCGAFTDPAPWYFRTLESWIRLFTQAGFRLLEMREPRHPTTQKPASVIFVAETVAARRALP